MAKSWRPFWQRVEAEAKPHEIAGEVEAEIDRRIELACHDHLHHGTEAAAALDAIRQNPAMRVRLQHILSEFLHGSGSRWQFRQGSLTSITAQLEKAETDLRDIMRRIGILSEEVSQAMIAFRDVPGIPEPQRVRVAAVDLILSLGFPDSSLGEPGSLVRLGELAEHAHALESAVLAAHGADVGSGKPLAETLQTDERDRFLSDLASLWRDTGRDIPKGKPREREPFVEFASALHEAMGAGDIPKVDDLTLPLASP